KHRQVCSFDRQRNDYLGQHCWVSAARSHLDAKLQLTDRGGGNPTCDLVLLPRLRMGPPPRSFAAMRMTASWLRSSRIDRIQVCGAMLAPDGELPSVSS